MRPREGLLQASGLEVSGGAGGPTVSLERPRASQGAFSGQPLPTVQPSLVLLTEDWMPQSRDGEQAPSRWPCPSFVLGASAEHVPYPLAGAVGAAGEVGGASFTETMAGGGRELAMKTGTALQKRGTFSLQEVQSSLGSCHSKPTPGFLPGPDGAPEPQDTVRIEIKVAIHCGSAVRQVRGSPRSACGHRNLRQAALPT